MKGKNVVLCLLVAALFLIPAVKNESITGDEPSEKKYIEEHVDFSASILNDLIYIERCANLIAENKPVVPFYTKTYVFPAGSKVSIEIYPQKIKKLDVMLPSSYIPSPPGFEIEQGSYDADIVYPERWYAYDAMAGLKNGKHVVILNIYLYPVRYVAGDVLFANEFEVKIYYRPPEKPLFTNDEYDLLIICPDSWMADLQPLKEHKESHGIKTIIVGLNEIYGGKYFASQGRDDAEKIKYFIKDAIEEWGIKYVMLVGGRQGGLFKERWLMPVRYANLDDQSNWEASYLSDLYFADIYKYEDGQPVFDDWDSNGNGKFAEWTMTGKDILDLYPDVYVGRLACRNKWEVDIMVNKIIEYETTTYGQPWFKRMVVIGGDSWPSEDDPYYEGEEENQAALEYMEGFEAIKLWTSLGTLTGPEDVINAVSQGCGFLFFDGHGNPMGWATHPPHDEETWIDGLAVGDMHKLSNKGMYPVCVVGGCHNCQFNVSVLNLLKIWEGSEWYQYIWKGETTPECWGWWLARKIDGGSIATLGYTGLDYFAIGDYDNDGIPDCTQYYSGFLNINFFKHYANGTDMLGAIHAKTLTDYINTHNPMKDNIHCKTVEEWVLLGDPSLKVGGYASS